MFPALKEALQHPGAFLSFSNTLLYRPCDGLEGPFTKAYPAPLQQIHLRLWLETLLFSLLTELVAPVPEKRPLCRQAEKAAAAKALLSRELRQKWTVAKMAKALDCSPSWLKKAFSETYGMGLYHYLRCCRMERARDLLLQGESLKAAAIEVGMKPGTFPKEFKAFYGCTVTAFREGLR
jgi:AraC-like DNA-binding protein